MSDHATRILLVDDDEDDFILFRDLVGEIQSQRFELEWAGDYAKGLARALARDHDLVVCDYRLGEKTGLDLMREISAKGIAVPAILLTGQGDHAVDQEAMRLGAADYLVKGQITPPLLERSVRYSLYRARMRSQVLSQERLASVGLLASSLAHEIGTPLGVIRGRAEYLGMRAAEDADLQKTVTVIVSQIDRVSRLIRSLLNLARGDGPGKTQPVSLAAAAAEVLDLISHDLSRSGISVNVRTSPLAWVTAEREKLHQVLLNLIVNASHAIEEAARQGRRQGHSVSIEVADAGKAWAISVRDTGCGISDDNKKNLFTPFFTTKTPDVGTGLGLVTSHWIIQSWGGTIEVESQLGAGSTFRVHLPKAEAPKA